MPTTDRRMVVLTIVLIRTITGRAWLGHDYYLCRYCHCCGVAASEWSPVALFLRPPTASGPRPLYPPPPPRADATRCGAVQRVPAARHRHLLVRAVITMALLPMLLSSQLLCYVDGTRVLRHQRSPRYQRLATTTSHNAASTAKTTTDVDHVELLLLSR